MLQLHPNMRFESLQDLNIDLSVVAVHAAPIAGHRDVRKPETVRSWFDQQHSDAYEVSSHHVRDIPQHVKFELLQISHRDSNLELRVSILEYMLHRGLLLPLLMRLPSSSEMAASSTSEMP